MIYYYFLWDRDSKDERKVVVLKEGMNWKVDITIHDENNYVLSINDLVSTTKISRIML